MSNPPVDAILLLSFGGPEGPDDVMPFLRNVTRGRNVPDERLAVVAEQYAIFGGRSPINDQCRELISALQAELKANGPDLPIYWGNRNWGPFLTDTVAEMANDGIKNALVFTTSAFGSFSGCRQYRQDLERARDETGENAPRLRKLRLFYNHPGFIEPMADNLRAAVVESDRTVGDDGETGGRRVVFTAHSIPNSMAVVSSYEAQLTDAAELTMEAAGLGGESFDLVFQSRSGPPSVPWLEPDINDHLANLKAKDITDVIVVPIGFVSDHMEVMFDLDTQAKQTAQELGMSMIRVPTVGVSPRFVTMIRELIEEQISNAPKLFVGAAGPWPDDCPAADHCIPAPGSGRPPSAARPG